LEKPQKEEYLLHPALPIYPARFTRLEVAFHNGMINQAKRTPISGGFV
jgi:hypothetical protein